MSSVLQAAGKVAVHAKELKELNKSCEGLESAFLRQMLHVMRESIQETKLGGDDTGMDTYRDMMDGALADKMAERSALGISKMAYHEMAERIFKGK